MELKTMDKVKMVVGLCKCAKHGKLFGIRFDQHGADWEMAWAFPLSEKAAAAEKYDRTKISGRFLTGAEYPGCPYCGNRSFWYCHYNGGHMNCYDGNPKNNTCRWCGWTGDLGGCVEEIDISQNV